MLAADSLREMVARKERGEGIRAARELRVDRTTVKRWLRVGAWLPRKHQRSASARPFAESIDTTRDGSRLERDGALPGTAASRIQRRLPARAALSKIDYGQLQSSVPLI